MHVWGNHYLLLKKLNVDLYVTIQNVCGQSIFISHSTLYALSCLSLIDRFNSDTEYLKLIQFPPVSERICSYVLIQPNDATSLVPSPLHARARKGLVKVVSSPDPTLKRPRGERGLVTFLGLAGSGRARLHGCA